MRSTGKLLGILVLLAMLAVACSTEKNGSNSSTVTFTDQLGRVVSLDKMPQRIVSLSPSNTEILFALGLGDKVVGVTKYDDFPAEAQTKPKVGGFSTIDKEAILAQSPDLVLASNIHEKEVIPELESLGLTVMALSPRTVNEVMQAIELVGKATGADSAASQIVKGMKAQLATVASQVKGLSAQEKPRVFYIVWHDPPMTVGGDTLISEVIELAGGKNIFDDLKQYPTVGMEVMLERQPQTIVVGVGHGSGQNAPLEWAKTDDQVKNTEALKQGKVFDIDANLVSRPGPRIVDALEEMLRLIHPNLAAKL